MNIIRNTFNDCHMPIGEGQQDAHHNGKNRNQFNFLNQQQMGGDMFGAFIGETSGGLFGASTLPSGWFSEVN